MSEQYLTQKQQVITETFSGQLNALILTTKLKATYTKANHS